MRIEYKHIDYKAKKFLGKIFIFCKVHLDNLVNTFIN